MGGQGRPYKYGDIVQRPEEMRMAWAMWVSEGKQKQRPWDRSAIGMFKITRKWGWPAYIKTDFKSKTVQVGGLGQE